MALPEKGVEDELAGVRAGADDAAEELLGHLAAVEAGALLEGAGDAGEVPDVLVGAEAVDDVLRADEPGIVREPAGRIRAGVAVDELAGRGDADLVVVERAVLRVLDEVEEMRVRAAELIFAVHAEGVVPDDPAPASEADLLAEEL